MPGYSGTPLAEKLGIKTGHRVALLGAPADFEARLDGLPPDVTFTRRLTKASIDVLLFFAPDLASFAARYDAAKAALDPAGGLWACWPKKASGVATDLTEDVIRTHALANGLVDNKVCAVTEIWSGLRLVVRLKDRPAPPRGPARPARRILDRLSSACECSRSSSWC